ncbi:MAG: type II toxin-antitoxin system VapC family toxin [Actinobacteria bacterium]|nr:MAG: type II toxin-antitoxin system VapC family toxin [Actinomycetota bacterium]
MTARRFLVDTDVIVEYLRGCDQAVKYLESLQGTLNVSAITVAELYSGVRDNEREALEQFLAAFDIVTVDQALARDAGLCRKSYQPAHGTGLADAIVAMSAKVVGAVLVTFNKRHCTMIEDLLVPYRRGEPGAEQAFRTDAAK